MNKNLFLFITLLFITGCSLDNDLTEYGNPDTGISETVLTPSRMFSPNDSPISIDNIREKTGRHYLPSTHIVERLNTSDIDLVHSLERDSSIIVYYQPIEIDEKYDLKLSCDNSVLGPTGIECNESPVLLDSLLTSSPIYLIVPIDYSLPSNVETERLFETFIPEESQLIEENQFRDHPSLVPEHLTGVIKSFDNRLSQYTPVGYALVTYYSIYLDTPVFNYTYTNALGEFTLEYPSMQSPITLSLRNSDFLVRSGLSTTVYTQNLGTPSDLLTFPSTHIQVFLPTNYYLDVYRAAQYYFYSSNDLLSAVTRYNTSEHSLDIYAVNSPDTENGYLGYFMPVDPSYIVIYNAYILSYSGAASKLFGTVLHELGHATNYTTVGQTNMQSTDSIIKESFASFFGWYNVRVFYSSVAPSESIVNSICTQGRQNWTSSSSNVAYSPFFIDLFDNYNQHTSLGTSYNDDPISGMSIMAILNLALGPQSFSSVYYPLAAYIGTFFTGSEYMTFVNPYTPIL